MGIGMYKPILKIELSSRLSRLTERIRTAFRGDNTIRVHLQMKELTDNISHSRDPIFYPRKKLENALSKRVYENKSIQGLTINCYYNMLFLHQPVLK
jgi:hypothetical protein